MMLRCLNLGYSSSLFHEHSHSSMGLFTSPPLSTNHSKPPAITLPASKHQCQVTAWWGKSVSLGRSIVTLSRLMWASASTPSLATCRAYLDSGPISKFATCGIQFAAFLHSHRFCTSRKSFYTKAKVPSIRKRCSTPEEDRLSNQYCKGLLGSPWPVRSQLAPLQLRLSGLVAHCTWDFLFVCC